MKFNPMLLDTTQTTNGFGDLIMIAALLVMFLLFYFLSIRPQKKKEKQIAEMRRSIMVGDKITTNGGIVGIVLKDTEDTLFILSGTQKLEVHRWAVRSIDKKVDADDDSDEETDDTK